MKKFLAFMLAITLFSGCGDSDVTPTNKDGVTPQDVMDRVLNSSEELNMSGYISNINDDMKLEEVYFSGFLKSGRLEYTTFESQAYTENNVSNEKIEVTENNVVEAKDTLKIANTEPFTMLEEVLKECSEELDVQYTCQSKILISHGDFYEVANVILSYTINTNVTGGPIVKMDVEKGVPYNPNTEKYLTKEEIESNELKLDEDYILTMVSRDKWKISIPIDVVYVNDSIESIVNNAHSELYFSKSEFKGQYTRQHTSSNDAISRLTIDVDNSIMQNDYQYDENAYTEEIMKDNYKTVSYLDDNNTFDRSSSFLQVTDSLLVDSTNCNNDTSNNVLTCSINIHSSSKEVIIGESVKLYNFATGTVKYNYTEDKITSIDYDVTMITDYAIRNNEDVNTEEILNTMGTTELILVDDPKFNNDIITKATTEFAIEQARGTLTFE